MQPADYFNLEFAPEPNPDMPGEYTARRRYINATRVFNFLPDNVCCNHQLSDEGSFGCTDSNDCLELTKKKNIIGKLHTNHSYVYLFLLKSSLSHLLILSVSDEGYSSNVL